ncbi:uncharacterized protein isoform X17 [Macaca fascicularis]|uniref:uncharacterized protein isoform X17 n=1 Tax=Macaca fascicularis TaxID=9541 RepID=UPI003D15B7FC
MYGRCEGHRTQIGLGSQLASMATQHFCQLNSRKGNKQTERPHGSCPGSSGQTQRVEDGGAYAFQTQVPGRADLHGCLHPSRLEFSIMMAALGSMQL